MAVEELKQQIEELVTKPLLAEGSELVEVVVSRYKGNVTVRLFVYSEHGATIDECVRLSRIVGPLLDGTDWFKNGYTLELSTPGLDRPLTEARDFKYRIGETVRVELVDSAKNKFTAEIIAADEQEVRFRTNETELAVPLAEIKKAKIVF